MNFIICIYVYMCVYIYYVLLVETTELYPGPHICDGTYSRVGSPGKIWLIKKIIKNNSFNTVMGEFIEAFSNRLNYYYLVLGILTL